MSAENPILESDTDLIAINENRYEGISPVNVDNVNDTISIDDNSITADKMKSGETLPVNISGNANTATTASDYANSGGIADALNGKLGTTGNASDTTSTFTKASGDTSDMTSGGKLSAIFTAISSFFGTLKSLAFKDKASYSDLSNGVQSSLDKADTALQSHQPVTDNNPTLAWGTTSTVGTVGSTDLQVTMPANPAADKQGKQLAVYGNTDKFVKLFRVYKFTAGSSIGTTVELIGRAGGSAVRVVINIKGSITADYIQFYDYNGDTSHYFTLYVAQDPDNSSKNLVYALLNQYGSLYVNAADTSAGDTDIDFSVFGDAMSGRISGDTAITLRNMKDASWINSGTFDAARIPTSLPNVTAGNATKAYVGAYQDGNNYRITLSDAENANDDLKNTANLIYYHDSSNGHFISIGNLSGTGGQTDIGGIRFAKGDGTYAYMSGTSYPGNAATATHLSDYGICDTWAANSYNSSTPYALITELTYDISGHNGEGSLLQFELTNDVIVKLKMSFITNDGSVSQARVFFIGGNNSLAWVKDNIKISYFTYTSNNKPYVAIRAYVKFTNNWQTWRVRQLDCQTGDLGHENWRKWTLYNRRGTDQANYVGTLATYVFVDPVQLGSQIRVYSNEGNDYLLADMTFSDSDNAAAGIQMAVSFRHANNKSGSAILSISFIDYQESIITGQALITGNRFTFSSADANSMYFFVHKYSTTRYGLGVHIAANQFISYKLLTSGVMTDFTIPATKPIYTETKDKIIPWATPTVTTVLPS